MAAPECIESKEVSWTIDAAPQYWLRDRQSVVEMNNRALILFNPVFVLAIVLDLVGIAKNM